MIRAAPAGYGRSCQGGTGKRQRGAWMGETIVWLAPSRMAPLPRHLLAVVADSPWPTRTARSTH